MGTLGDRIKRYEATSNVLLTSRMPVIIRVDGRAFHTFTRQFEKPFDKDLMESMVMAAKTVAEDMQGFKVAYIQSDEATFCITDYDTLDTEGWFAYELPKIISISASKMTASFIHYMAYVHNKNIMYNVHKMPIFDSRAFNVPVDDVANVFLWRAKDWERNSLSMYCRSFFSHKELHKKGRIEMHEMLYKIGKNWTNDLTEREKNGSFLVKDEEGKINERNDIKPDYISISGIVNKLIGGAL